MRPRRISSGAIFNFLTELPPVDPGAWMYQG
jgi:hypothetical protein